MKQLLDFLARFCIPLFEKHKFRFKDSGTGQSVVAGAWILLDSGDVQLHLSYERGEFIMSLRSLYDPNKKNWFSIDLILQLLGRKPETGLMDETNSNFWGENTDQILAKFREEKSQTTIAKLNCLKAERVKRT
jgi:hypothetical protein